MGTEGVTARESLVRYREKRLRALGVKGPIAPVPEGKTLKLNDNTLLREASEYMRIENLERFADAKIEVPWMDEADWEDYGKGEL